MSSTHILVLLDGSGRAEAILPHALSLACMTGSDLMLLRVITPPEQPAGRPIFVPERWYDDEHAWSQKYLASTAQRLQGKGVIVHTEIVYGDAGDHSVSYIHQNVDIHMVALATRGRSTVGRWILGSVTEQVMHATTLPLLLLYPDEHAGVENPPIVAAVYRCLIVLLEGSALDEYALDYARMVARPAQTKVVLVSISSMLDENDFDDEQQTSPPEDEHQQTQRAAYLARQAQQLRTAAGLTVETEFAVGDSVAWVERLTRQQRDVLVITPYRSHSDYLALRFLHHMNIPVLLASQGRVPVGSGQTVP